MPSRRRQSSAAMDTVLRPLELTVAQYSCLEVLNQRPGVSSAELARAVFVTRQSMNPVLQGYSTAACSPEPPSLPTARRCPPSSPTRAVRGCARPASRSALSRSRCSSPSARPLNNGFVPTSPSAPPRSAANLGPDLTSAQSGTDPKQGPRSVHSGRQQGRQPSRRVVGRVLLHTGLDTATRAGRSPRRGSPPRTCACSTGPPTAPAPRRCSTASSCTAPTHVTPS